MHRTFRIRQAHDTTDQVVVEIIHEARTPHTYAYDASLEDAIANHPDIAWDVLTDAIRQRDGIRPDLLAIGTALPDGQEG